MLDYSQVLATLQPYEIEACDSIACVPSRMCAWRYVAVTRVSVAVQMIRLDSRASNRLKYCSGLGYAKFIFSGLSRIQVFRRLIF